MTEFWRSCLKTERWTRRLCLKECCWVKKTLLWTASQLKRRLRWGREATERSAKWTFKENWCQPLTSTVNWMPKTRQRKACPETLPRRSTNWSWFDSWKTKTIWRTRNISMSSWKWQRINWKRLWTNLLSCSRNLKSGIVWRRMCWGPDLKTWHLKNERTVCAPWRSNLQRNLIKDPTQLK
jgi:hypothetical protein